MGERLEEAARENDMLESEVIRRALRYYEDRNPDGIAVFEDVQHGSRVARVDPAEVPRKGEGGDEIVPTTEPVEEGGDQEKAASGDGGLYDPTEDLARDEEEVGETGESDVYDPMGEDR